MIRISKLTDYSILLLTHFAVDPERSVFNARDLGERAGLPLPTVSKLLKALSRGALLSSQRGVNGGYQLARAPELISVADIIAAIEGPIAMTECTSQAPGLCDLEANCPVGPHWQKINAVVGQALRGLSLADMARPMVVRELAARSATARQARLPGPMRVDRVGAAIGAGR